ncbi:MAG: sigma-70 family RNA polymerase sigma factor [Spirochaetales bacterium]|nr:sigma-70 family RNA polymerase sigma factor [Spirochaetales bacterium]
MRVRKRNKPAVHGRKAAAGALPNEESEDFILIRRFLRTGDPREFRTLVERHLPSIRRLLYTLFNGQREEMEDAEQEIVLSLFQRLKDFQFRSSFRTYFYRLARNRGIDFLRKKRSQDRTVARLRLDLWNRELPGPEEQVVHREETETLLAVFQTLPSKDRQLILMKDVDGFTLDEMADILDVPIGTVKSRLHRAREKLAKHIRGRR